MQLLKAESSNL